MIYNKSMTTKRRETKYTRAIKSALTSLGHATNSELAQVVRADFPMVSDTTIHRVTQRFYDDGECIEAPKSQDGATRYDANTSFHDHFICESCGGMRDIVIPAEVRRAIEQELDGCCLNGSLSILGECKKCKER